VEDTTGPLGSRIVGLYDTSAEVNLSTDLATRLYAGWFVSRGTVEGYRYPVVTVDLRANPELAAAWLAVRPGHRVDVTNLSTVLPHHPAGTLSLMVEGVENEITSGTWIGTLKCSPYAVWKVALAAEDTGSTGEFLGRAVSDGSTLAATALAGATSLSVATPTGPLWTTTADDFPLTVAVGGVDAVVSAISGAASPQTFTIAALSATRPLGCAVEVSNPAVAGL
jgi:hypothetical protein